MDLRWNLFNNPEFLSDSLHKNSYRPKIVFLINNFICLDGVTYCYFKCPGVF